MSLPIVSSPRGWRHSFRFTEGSREVSVIGKPTRCRYFFDRKGGVSEQINSTLDTTLA
jgi:hypothetical protein